MQEAVPVPRVGAVAGAAQRRHDVLCRRRAALLHACRQNNCWCQNVSSMTNSGASHIILEPNLQTKPQQTFPHLQQSFVYC